MGEARANSPAYRQTLNDAGPAKWGVRNAYASLLPSVSVGSIERPRTTTRPTPELPT